MPDLNKALKDFVATSNSGKYKSESELLSKFPELNGLDVKALKDYVATSNSGKYQDEATLNSKFPELFTVKKKENSVSTAPKENMVSASEPISVVSPKKQPSTEAELDKYLKTVKVTPENMDEVSSMTDQLSAIRKAKAPKTTQTTPKKETRGFGAEMLSKLEVGSAQLGADFAAAPEFLYEMFAAPQNFIADKAGIPSLKTDSEKLKKDLGIKNKIKESYQNQVAKLRENSAQVDKKYEAGIYDSFSNGNIEDGFRQLTGSFSESLPATLGIMMGGAYAKAPQLLAASTMVFGAGKNEQLKDENPDLSTNARVANAFGTGLAEGAFELIGSGSIGAAARGLIEREGKKKATTILRDGLATFYKETLKKNPLTASVAGEGITEWATQVTQNAVDVATGVKDKDFNIFTDSVDALISGAFGGTVFGGGLKGIDKIVNIQDRGKIKENTKAVFSLQTELENPNISETTRSEIENTINELVTTNQDLIGNSVSNIENLSPRVRAKLDQSLEALETAKTTAREISLDGSSEQTKKTLLASLKTKADEASNSVNSILEGTITELDALPLKEQETIKRQAMEDLVSELNPDGTKDMTITDEQVVERANMLLKESDANEAKAKTEPDKEEFLKPIEENADATRTNEESIEETPAQEEVVAEESVIEPIEELPTQPEQEIATEQVVEPANEILEQPKTTVKRVKSVKNAEYDVTYNENGSVQKINSVVDGREIPKFNERTIKKTGKKTLVRNPNYSQIEADATDGITNNGALKEKKESLRVAFENFTPTDAYSAAMAFIASGGKINSESAAKETGAKKKELKWLTGLKADNTLPNVGAAAHSIWGNRGELDINTQDIRNALIDIILTTKNLSEAQDKFIGLYENNVAESQRQELEFMKGQLTESELAMFEALEAEDGYLAELTDREAIEYYEQKINDYEEGKRNKEANDAGITIATESDATTQGTESTTETAKPEVKQKPTKIKDIFNQDNIKEDLDWLDSLKLDTNNLNSTLPFLPQVFNALIDAVKVARMAGNSMSKAVELAQAELSKKYDYKDVDNAIDAFIEKSGLEIEKPTLKTEPKTKPIDPKPTVDSDAKSKPQAFSTRAFESENLNSKVKESLTELGLNYDVQNQTTAQANAEKIISELGIVEAYKLAKDGQIRGGARMWIMAQMKEELNQQVNDAYGKGDIELGDYLQEEFAKIIKQFANELTLTGQELSMLNRIYEKFGMKYEIDFAREKWKSKFKKEIPLDVEARLKIVEKQLEDYQKREKELEERIGTLEEQDAINNLKDKVARAKTQKPTESSLKRAAAALRKAKFTQSINDLSKLQSDASGLIKGIFDGAIETIATALDAGSTIEQAVKKGIIEIKKSDWYQKLSDKNKVQAEKIAKKTFQDFIKEETTKVDSDADSNVDQGAVKIPPGLLYELVSSGIDNIVDLTNAVHDVIQNDYPNLTHREVRDAITGYGKQIAETQDNILKEISRLKTDGKQSSALEDLNNGQRPKRSGRKAKKYTEEQRNNIKKIRELLKNLPIDDSVDMEAYYKNALETYKTRISNRIKDLTDAINKNERIIAEKRTTPLDAEAERLIAEREEVQKEYDAHFGKPYKSDQTLIEEILARKEKSLRDLETKLADIIAEGKEKPKAEKRTVSDPRIDAINAQIEAKRDDLNDVLEQVGIAEAKRLARGVAYSKRRLAELKEKLRVGDFTKRKPKAYKYNAELIKLKGEIIIEKTKWDIEFEKQELRELGYGEKVLEYTYRAFGTFKGLKATADLSAMLRQGVVLGSRNIKEYMNAAVDMHKFAFDSKAYKDWMTELETSEDFIYMNEDGLSITDTSGDVLRGEERFVGNLLGKKIKVGGVDINLIGRLTEGSERAYGGFLNSLRVAVYRKFVNQYEIMGITRQEHPKKYKNIAKFVNNATGRGVMTSDKRVAKVLNMLLFSPRMITGMAGIVKDMVRTDSTPYLRKQAATSLIAFAGYQFVMKMIIWQALSLLAGDDDKEEVTMDMNPVSTDFNKVKKGDKRYDVSSGYGIGIRTLARVVMNETSSGIDSENKSFDDMRGRTRWSEIPQFFLNKFSPLASQIYGRSIGRHPTDFTGKAEDATTLDYVNALFVPISVTDLVENIENKTPAGEVFFDLMMNTYGVGVQEYGTSNDPVSKITEENEATRKKFKAMAQGIIDGTKTRQEVRGEINKIRKESPYEARRLQKMVDEAVARKDVDPAVFEIKNAKSAKHRAIMLVQFFGEDLNNLDKMSKENRKFVIELRKNNAINEETRFEYNKLTKEKATD